MAAKSQSERPSLGTVLVTGGCGFLGHHIVDLLVTDYDCKIAVIDLRTNRNRRPDSDGVRYFDVDILQPEALDQVFDAVSPDVVIHTVSPLVHGQGVSRAVNEVFRTVNVDGTRNIVEACQRHHVKALVYTSSSSVVSDNVTDLVNVDERWPVITGKLQNEYYTQTKAEAEALVLAANRQPPSPSLLTCAIRPSGIFGEGDQQMIPGAMNVFKSNKHKFQLGPNNNLFDFTYAKNVAHGHLLAALALLRAHASSTPIPDDEKVDGEAFFITNGEPVYFWDMLKSIWAIQGSQLGPNDFWVIPKDLGIAIGWLAETVSWCLGRQSLFTRQRVVYTNMTRYFNIQKARSRLGYEPIYGMQEAVERSVRWFLEEEKKAGEKKAV
ncbi:hypothetical protein VTO42DRAFT_4499 [Malbranchea cinnamomea]